ncbi:MULTISPECIES: hypothetical protein [unclassified Streptomyces]|uniref:hypothetical protein n=1 Tax=unclassified Streptomyces TaxID=2593676 RepID=UPI002E28AD31|nr:hypothetical protein [Streptomyces sp. NBC_01439]
MSHGADGPEEQLEQRLTAAELAAARALAGRLPALIEELAACGLPGTLLHGDFPPATGAPTAAGPWSWTIR